MVRLRFAPSPTGYLHIGGLRTALFSYLYAKQQNGSFVFRLEDTDQQRLVEGSEQDLLKMLKWAGLEIDEGPGIGGDYGPYRQSERLETYQKYAQQLLDSGHAYYCFCTPEELEVMKREQQAQGLPTRYDGRHRNLPLEEVKQRLGSGESYVIRMKIPEANENIVMHDEIRGTVTIESEQLEDQVIVKADGFPTYHLASVVDDHLMQITHVVRGEEWLPSLPKHILLYRYFNWEPPHFLHLPLILNPDLSKLSKRQGDVAVEDYQAKGYLPMALVNFIALLGWSSGDDQELFSREELIEKFSFDRVNKAGAVFDQDKLNWMNQQHILSLSPDGLYAWLKPFIMTTPFGTQEENLLKRVCAILQPRLVTLKDVTEKLALFFEEEPTLKDQKLIEVLQKETSRTVLEAFRKEIQAVEEMNGDTFKSLMKTIQKSTKIRGKDLWMPMRYALTLEEHGPDLPLVAEIFGKKKCLQMVEQALNI